MNLVAELSLYPLTGDHEAKIIHFIRSLEDEPGLLVRTNQLSTQIQGEFDVVTDALNRCLKHSMEVAGSQVLVVKYLNSDLDIARDPVLD